ncbi:TIGR03618 family F420-dependent PPOX class oxidoreductase [Nakamurella sp. YIM 132087]|uniref:TIGR03618 family F420-dependent PPOX class oxidoreductase n=1 Tax=Nakamurella alba TaxID=2665158 RepID=A0A7K1FN16_9ACTN|nr:PPOX class F420-dependent oxidoreductase [Nakamurella alba]MTD15561.1 TIGR03618 family F420-dependent PPOX class oxidoreductase [Nakamurella alba]
MAIPSAPDSTQDTAPDPRFSPAALEFLTERHLASLSTPLHSGRIHAVPTGFTVTGSTAWVITSGPSQKVQNVRRAGTASICQIDGARWLTLIGPATVLEDPDSVREAERRYAARYRVPRVNPLRVVIEVRIEKILGSRSISLR